MKRAIAIAGFAAAAALLVRLSAMGAEASAPIPVVDLHVDLSYQTNYKAAPFDSGSGEYVASKLLASGVSGVVLPLYVPKDVSPQGPRLADLEHSLSRILEYLPKTPPYALPGCDAHDGRVRTWLAFEGAAPLADNPASVDDWVKRGVRIFGLVHSYDNALATSSGVSGATHGLTDAGREVVRRVFAAHAVVDVSHASDPATEDILSIAKTAGGVVVATHSDARALAPHPRNLTDAQLRKIADTGGVVGLNFHSRFLVRQGQASINDVVRHARHMVIVSGIEHVAIGSDFEGGIRPPPELRDVSGFPRLARALLDSGMSRDDVEKIFYRNALRVLCPVAK